MPRRKPKKINYMDMKIPLECFKIPKSKREQAKLIKRFETEFGSNYQLDPIIDPCYDVNMKTLCHTYEHNSIEEKIERIRRRNKLTIDIKNAKAKNDLITLSRCNLLRDTRGNDNGINMAPIIERRIKNVNDR